MKDFCKIMAITIVTIPTFGLALQVCNNTGFVLTNVSAYTNEKKSRGSGMYRGSYIVADADRSPALGEGDGIVLNREHIPAGACTNFDVLKKRYVKNVSVLLKDDSGFLTISCDLSKDRDPSSVLFLSLDRKKMHAQNCEIDS